MDSKTKYRKRSEFSIFMYYTRESKIVYQNNWIQVYEDSIENNHGKIEVFNRIVTHDIVGVVPIFENGSLLMIKNYRHPVGRKFLEFPGGIIEKNEKPMKTAHRELLEETGYRCKSLKANGWFYSSPGRTTQKVYVFIAKGLDLVSKQKLDEFEDSKVIKLSHDQVVNKIKNGSFKNSLTISILSMTNFGI